MIKDHVVPFVRVRKRALLIVLALMAPLTSLGSTSLASAETVPTGEWAIFKQCPRFLAEGGDEFCVYSEITGGVTTLNKLTVPITRPWVFQGMFEGEDTRNLRFFGALDGETISRVPEPIPGGISALIDCSEIKGRKFLDKIRRKACEVTFENRWIPRSFRNAYETLELARPATEIKINLENSLFEEGTALTLPVRIHLESPLLGNQCYIGSTANPIILEMGTGTTNPPPPNKPISGKNGTPSYNAEFNRIHVIEHTSVDNSLAVPEAKGCGGRFSWLVDPLINSKVGLPAPAGYNTVIHSGTVTDGFVPPIIASEEEVKTDK